MGRIELDALGNYPVILHGIIAKLCNFLNQFIPYLMSCRLGAINW